MKKLVSAIFVLSIVLQIKAADFDIYGRVAPGVWFSKYEWFYDDSIATDSATGNTIKGSDSVPYFYCTVAPYGDFGFRIKGEKINACVEVGVRQSAYAANISGSTNPRLFVREHWLVYARSFYLQWLVNDWMKLLLGQAEAPACFFSSNQRYYGGNNFRNTGSLYTGSNAMVQFSFGKDLSAKEHESGFLWEAKIAAVKVDTAAVPLFPTLTTPASIDVKCDAKFPKFEGSLGMHFEKNIFATDLELGGGFQQYIISLLEPPVELELTAEESREDVNCFIFGFNYGLKFGPVRVSYNWAWGQNVGAYGAQIGNPFMWRGVLPGEGLGMGKADAVEIFYPVHEAITDTSWRMSNGKTVETCVVLNVKPLEWLSFEGGYGYVHADHEFKAFDKSWCNTHAYYAGAQLKVADVFEINPEFGQYLYGNKPGYGRLTYWGLEFAVEF